MKKPIFTAGALSLVLFSQPLLAANLEQRVERLERLASNPVMLEMKQTMNSQQRQIQDLQNRLDLLLHKSSLQGGSTANSTEPAQLQQLQAQIDQLNQQQQVQSVKLDSVYAELTGLRKLLNAYFNPSAESAASLESTTEISPQAASVPGVAALPSAQVEPPATKPLAEASAKPDTVPVASNAQPVTSEQNAVKPASSPRQVSTEVDLSNKDRPIGLLTQEALLKQEMASQNTVAATPAAPQAVQPVAQPAVNSVPTPSSAPVAVASLPVAPAPQAPKAAPSVTAAPEVATPVAPATSVRDQEQQFQLAFALMRDTNYAESIKAFETFQQNYPSNEKAGNALYWAGEGYFVTRQFDKSLQAFQKVINQYADSKKVSDAYLRMGDSYEKLGDIESAKAAYQQLIEAYANSRAAAVAKKRLEKLAQSSTSPQA